MNEFGSNDVIGRVKALAEQSEVMDMGTKYRPWKIVKVPTTSESGDTTHKLMIVSPDGTPIALLDGRKWDNATYILRSANNFETLINLLKIVRPFIPKEQKATLNTIDYILQEATKPYEA